MRNDGSSYRQHQTQEFVWRREEKRGGLHVFPRFLSPMIPGASLMDGILGAGVAVAAAVFVADARSLPIFGLDLAEAAALRLADALPGGESKSSAVAEGWRRNVVVPGGPVGGKSSLMSPMGGGGGATGL